MTLLAIALGLAAAALFAVGAVAQQQEASSLDGRGAHFVRELIRRPRWWAATFGDAVGYTFQAIGLAVGSILIVQPLLIASLVFALPLAARWNARPIHRSQIMWAGAIAVSLALFIIVGHPDGGRDTTPFRNWVPSLIGCGVVVAIGLGLAFGRSVRLRSLGLAMMAGTLFGLASALTKSLMHLLGTGIGTALGSWETYAIVVAGIAGIVCQQLAFQAGSLEISFPAATVLDPLTSVVVGIAALDERVRADGAEWIVIGAAVMVMFSGTIALARAGVPTPTTRTGATPAPASQPPAA
jgi:drug/metabolite transporter (DMT)-like permease